MAAKYQLITELYRRTGVSVAKSPQAWQAFLSSACRNYKCRFDEQLLIYAQRPDATQSFSMLLIAVRPPRLPSTTDGLIKQILSRQF